MWSSAWWVTPFVFWWLSSWLPFSLYSKIYLVLLKSIFWLIQPFASYRIGALILALYYTWLKALNFILSLMVESRFYWIFSRLYRILKIGTCHFDKCQMVSINLSQILYGIKYIELWWILDIHSVGLDQLFEYFVKIFS